MYYEKTVLGIATKGFQGQVTEPASHMKFLRCVSHSKAAGAESA